MTSALESLHRNFPGQYLTNVKTSCDEIFWNNPHITPLKEYREIHMDNQLVHSSHMIYHFMHNYCKEFERHLNIKLELCVNHPYIYLSDEEKSRIPINERYAVINAGRKDDYTTKHWGWHNYQKVVDLLKHKITFVQIGENNPSHYHPPLRDTINMIGQTTSRQLICLCYHSLFGIGPVTFIHHIYAAFEKAYFCIASGFEPLHWEMYPTTIAFSSQGKLKCCQKGGCWRGKVVPGTGEGRLCELPVIDPNHILDSIPECLNMIKPETVAETIDYMLEHKSF